MRTKDVQIHVERRYDLEPVAGEAAICGQRTPEVPSPHQDRQMSLVEPEGLAKGPRASARNL